MSTSELLNEIRPAWIEKVSHRLARGAGVRENFLEQLNRFFDLLQHAVETGDPAWLDPLLHEWVHSQMQTDVEVGVSGLAPFLTQLILLTFETCQETQQEIHALELFGVLLPLLTYAYENVAEIESRIKINHIETDLKDAQQELELLDRSKSKFIEVAAHELKTPLTLIEGYATMLREKFPREDQESHPVLLLKGIDNGTQRLREIVDDMIDVSLIDNDMLSLNYQPIWMNRLLGIIEKELDSVFAERRLAFKVHPFPGWDEMTFGDPERLYQAIYNLVINAVKYTPDGGEISVHGRSLPGFIEITIADTGIGIDSGDQGRIFDKFGVLGEVQFHSSGKSKFKGGGPGLGLSITRGIIEAHGGTIWVESEGYNEADLPGSTFHLLLPLHESPPDDKSKLLFGTMVETEDGPS